MEKDKVTCIICLEKLAPRDAKVETISCRCWLHKSCFDQWNRTSLCTTRCPRCSDTIKVKGTTQVTFTSFASNYDAILYPGSGKSASNPIKIDVQDQKELVVVDSNGNWCVDGADAKPEVIVVDSDGSWTVEKKSCTPCITIID